MVTLDTFYQSKPWVKLMQTIKLNRVDDNGDNICEYCGKPIVAKYDCIGHHIEPLNERNVRDAMISLNPDNVMLVHHKCHNIIHEKFVYKPKQIYIVYGAPLSGKSTWVENNRNVGDLVIDIDRIWMCVSGCAQYIKPDCLKSNVFGVRDTLIEQAKYRRGKWNNCYIVGGYPLVGERERLIRSLGAREIFIDTSREECHARLVACADGRSKSEWSKYIDDWFDKYSPQVSY